MRCKVDRKIKWSKEWIAGRLAAPGSGLVAFRERMLKGKVKVVQVVLS